MNHDRMSDHTVRGRIRNFLLDHVTLLQEPLLEVGSLLPMQGNECAFWAYNRNLVPDGFEWIGLDFQEGDNVDVVADIEKPTPFDDGSFQTVLCSEVMEHLYKPWLAIEEMYRLLKDDGWVVITTLFSFPVHGYPDDYWRFSPSCMTRLLEDAGFKNVKVLTAGETHWDLANDKEGQTEHKTGPIHIFAVGQK